MNAMAKLNFSNPEESARPFDDQRCGFVLGEGAGMLVLEELEHAKRRDAPIYAEILGYSCQSDGYHLTQPDSQGKGCARAIKKALESANIPISALDLVNCHATST
jgi:3-oxoacyl-[acyl-carrier-protein] synthase II